MSCEHCGCECNETAESPDEAWATARALGVVKPRPVPQGTKMLDLTRHDPHDLMGFPELIV